MQPLWLEYRTNKNPFSGDLGGAGRQRVRQRGRIRRSGHPAPVRTALELPEKDQPIYLAARSARAIHLLTRALQQAVSR